MVKFYYVSNKLILKCIIFLFFSVKMSLNKLWDDI